MTSVNGQAAEVSVMSTVATRVSSTLVFHLVREIHFGRADFAAFAHELYQAAALAVCRGGEHAIIQKEGRRDIRGPVGRVIVTPEKPAVVGRHADHAAMKELHVLP